MGGGGGSGKVAMNDFSFVCKVSKASPKLMAACASGDHMATALVTVRKAGGAKQEYFKYVFSEVMVSAYHNNVSAHGDIVPMDHVSLSFAKVEMVYQEQKKDGTLGPPVKSGWDRKQNKPV
jgi:type VI secretion system secreted protein Hcp